MHLCTRQCTRFQACHRQALSIRILVEQFVDSAEVGTVREKRTRLLHVTGWQYFFESIVCNAKRADGKRKETLDRFTPHNT
jgi:hypothetical protein